MRVAAGRWPGEAAGRHTAAPRACGAAAACAEAGCRRGGWRWAQRVRQRRARSPNRPVPRTPAGREPARAAPAGGRRGCRTVDLGHVAAALDADAHVHVGEAGAAQQQHGLKHLEAQNLRLHQLQRDACARQLALSAAARRGGGACARGLHDGARREHARQGLRGAGASAWRTRTVDLDQALAALAVGHRHGVLLQGARRERRVPVSRARQGRCKP